MKKKIVRYWDSDCFLGWFKQETDKFKACKDIIDHAESGKIIIVHSAITLTEVIRLKKRTPLPKDKELMIVEFFERNYLRLIEVDRQIANYARQLIWDHNLQPKDSIHVATAILRNIPVLNAFDDDLVGLDDKLKLSDGTKNLRIQKPTKLSPEELAFE